MRIYLPFYFFLLFLINLSSCVTPINSRYETAQTLGKGKMELAGGIANYTPRVNRSDEGQLTQYQVLGGRLGYGLNDKIDLKLRYEHLVIPSMAGFNANFIELYGKFKVTDENDSAQASFIQGLGTYFTHVPDHGTEGAASLSLGSIMTFKAGNFVDVTSTLQTIFMLPYIGGASGNETENIFDQLDKVSLETGWQFDLSLGISSDFSRWAIRPFAGVGVGHVRKSLPNNGGLIANPNSKLIVRAASWNYGIGFNYTFQ